MYGSRLYTGEPDILANYSATAAVVSAAAAVVSWQAAVVSWQAAALSLQHAGASASGFSVLALLPAQATSIAATAAIANRFFIIVYLINVVIVSLSFEDGAKLSLV